MDLIDRQSAIEACLRYNGVGWVWSQILDEIKEIPSAVVRRKDCKYQDKGENESESWNVCKYRPWLYFSIDDDDYCSNGERDDVRRI